MAMNPATARCSRRSLMLAAAAAFVGPKLRAQSEAERAKVQKLLEDGAQRFREVIADVDEEQWNARVSSIRHTVGEEAEHLALSENDIQVKVHEALNRPALPDTAKELAGKEKFLEEFLLGEGKSAENFRASGKLINKAEVLEYYAAAHRKLMNLFRDSQDLDLHVSEHPVSEVGLLTALQWFYYIAYHRERHIRQIEAIKSHPEYPRVARSAD